MHILRWIYDEMDMIRCIGWVDIMKVLAYHDLYKMKCKITFNERTLCIDYDAYNYNEMHCMTIKRLDAYTKMQRTICINIMPRVICIDQDLYN